MGGPRPNDAARPGSDALAAMRQHRRVAGGFGSAYAGRQDRDAGTGPRTLHGAQPDCDRCDRDYRIVRRPVGVPGGPDNPDIAPATARFRWGKRSTESVNRHGAAGAVGSTA